MTEMEKKVVEDCNIELYDMVRCASESHRQVSCSILMFKKFHFNSSMCVINDDPEGARVCCLILMIWMCDQVDLIHY